MADTDRGCGEKEIRKKIAGTEEMLDLRCSAGGVLTMAFSGRWKLADGLPRVQGVLNEIEKGTRPELLTFDTAALSGWDSGFVIFLMRIMEYCSRENIAVDGSALPGGVRRLLHLAGAVPVKTGAGENPRLPLLARIGDLAMARWRSFLSFLEFLGETTLSFSRLFTGRARFRPTDLWLMIQECGADALPIVSLISVLVGLILAFVGSIQLKTFGAQIYIADLVGIAMVRAMGAIMTGIIMAGRTGAAFAARIGTMQVNEEIDALKTTGISPIDFLVLPRVVALALMMPLLTLYADLMGMLGGLAVGVAGFDISVREYYNETLHSLTATNLFIGVFSGLVFGVLVAVAGCLRGMQCGRSASAVGDATTSAVVTGIVSIIVATAIITVVCNVYHI
ncbi:MAG TPA: ABC transporter permease [Geobacteraceae bacterium]